MTEEKATTEATTEAAAEPKPPATGKDKIYEDLGQMVKDMTDKRIGKTGGRKLFDAVVNAVFAEATKEGSFRFNGGFGSMHVKNYKAGSRRLPNGTETTFGPRKKLRYEEGVVVSALVKNGGNLEEAFKARGSRKPAEKPAAVDDKPAEADGGAADAATTEAATTEESSDIDLD